MEKAASMTITRKMDWTTERVVWRPTLSALRVTSKPSWQPISAIVPGEKRRL